MADPCTLDLLEIGVDFHRKLFLLSREDRLLVAVALLSAALQEYAPPVRDFAFNAAMSRGAAAATAAQGSVP